MWLASFGTDPVGREWWIIGLSKIAIGLITCLSMAKGSESIAEQLWVASRREIISENDGRMNSSKHMEEVVFASDQVVGRIVDG